MGSNTNRLSIRPAQEKDAELILSFIRELAVYENMEDQITATAEDLRRSIFERQQAEVIIGWIDHQPAAFALYFYNYSTFLGKANLFLDDLYVKEEFRGQGIGRAMLQYLSQTAVKNSCERLDWLCLDWNLAAAGFYKGLGAQVLDDRRVFRLSGERLAPLAPSRSSWPPLPHRNDPPLHQEEYHE